VLQPNILLSNIFCRVTVPSSYDIGYVGYNTETNLGIFNFFFSYCILDLSFYVNIFVNFRLKVYTADGKSCLVFFLLLLKKCMFSKRGLNLKNNSHKTDCAV